MAEYNLGVCYSKGQGVPLSYSNAVKYFRKAADKGFADAQYNLGVCYYHGYAVAKSEHEAAKWWSRAAKQGHKGAADALKQL